MHPVIFVLSWVLFTWYTIAFYWDLFPFERSLETIQNVTSFVPSIAPHPVIWSFLLPNFYTMWTTIHIAALIGNTRLQWNKLIYRKQTFIHSDLYTELCMYNMLMTFTLCFYENHIVLSYLCIIFLIGYVLSSCVLEYRNSQYSDYMTILFGIYLVILVHIGCTVQEKVLYLYGVPLDQVHSTGYMIYAIITSLLTFTAIMLSKNTQIMVGMGMFTTMGTFLAGIYLAKSSSKARMMGTSP